MVPPGRTSSDIYAHRIVPLACLITTRMDPPKSTTYGVLLLGSFIAMALSGIVTVQSYVYFKLYSTDVLRIRYLVAIIWILDSFHSFVICSAIWYYFIPNFGEGYTIHQIPWSVALSIACTAIVTFLVHCFYCHRIFKFSNRNWILTVPMVALSSLRLCSACVSTAEMIRLKTFPEFERRFRWAFTLGLSLSSGVDILLTVTLCYFLLTNRSGSSRSNHIIDLLLLYTSETGALTSAAALASLICWLCMPFNLIFLGIHFVIGKLYANSLLLTLNTRKQLRKGWVRGFSQGSLQPVTFFTGDEPQRKRSKHNHRISNPKLQISVQKTVERDLADTGSRDDELGVHSMGVGGK